MRFWCSLPTADTSSFVPLELLVTAASSSTPRYRRIIHVNEVGKWAGNGGGVGVRGLGPRPPYQPHSAVLLDAPDGLLARQAEEGGHVVLRWLPPPGAPMTTHIRYEVDVSAGNGAGGSQRVRPARTAQPRQLCSGLPGLPKCPPRRAPLSRSGSSSPVPDGPHPSARCPRQLHAHLHIGPLPMPL